MGIVIRLNKRRRTPLIDNNLIHNVIYTTLLTVKYSKEAYARFKKESETASSGIIRKRCRALMAKTCIPEAKLFLIMFRIHGLVKIVCNFVFFNIC